MDPEAQRIVALGIAICLGFWGFSKIIHGK